MYVLSQCYEGTIPENYGKEEEKGFWNPLYDDFKRLGCWFCPKQNLKSLKVPTTVTTIKEYAFAHCDSLINIDIPSSVVIIEQGAFGNTAWFKAQPDGLVYINNVLYSTKGTIRSDTSLVALPRLLHARHRP